MIIRNWMKGSVISISQDASLGDAANLFGQHHIGTLPVVDQNNKLVGILHLRDLYSLVMPDFVSLLDHFEFAHDFGAVETRQPDPEDLKRLVKTVMELPVSVEDTSGLLRTLAMLNRYDVRDIPVVDKQGHLVGIASHVDVGIALIKTWKLNGTQ